MKNREFSIKINIILEELDVLNLLPFYGYHALDENLFNTVGADFRFEKIKINKFEFSLPIMIVSTDPRFLLLLKGFLEGNSD